MKRVGVIMKKSFQMSESLEVAIFLALSGGLMDAYSYLIRGKVFANAQTGNILLLGVSLSNGQWNNCLKYIFPIVSFSVGILLAQVIRNGKIKKIHWRQVALFVEIILLVFVAFIPYRLNYFANAVTSLACGIQVQTFRKLKGRDFATTMCLGNLRKSMHYTYEYFDTKNRIYLESAVLYISVILFFVLGAIIGSKASKLLGLRTILLSPIFLFVSMVIMFIDNEK